MKNQKFTSPSQSASIMPVFRQPTAVASSVVTSAVAHCIYEHPAVLFSGETVSENSLSLRKVSEHNSIRGALAVQWQWVGCNDLSYWMKNHVHTDLFSALHSQTHSKVIIVYSFTNGPVTTKLHFSVRKSFNFCLTLWSLFQPASYRYFQYERMELGKMGISLLIYSALLR